MATREELNFLRWTTEADRGCHDDMRCACDPVFRKKMERAKQELGPFFEAFLDHLCVSCPTTPVVPPTGGGTVQTGTTPPPVTVPPVVVPPLTKPQPPVVEPPVVEPPVTVSCYDYPSPDRYELSQGTEV